VLRYRDADWLSEPGNDAGTVLMVGEAPEQLAGPPLTDAYRAWRRSLGLATFGRTQVRVVVPSVAAYNRQVATDRRERREAAVQLATATPQLSLARPAAWTLATGAVDGRLLTVLASLAAGHRITVAALPAVPGEYGVYSLHRVARITTYDGAAVATGTAGAQKLRQWLTAQLPPYQPLMSLSEDGLTLRYPSPSPLGLLGS
jgi:uracil-DNA glycosylase